MFIIWLIILSSAVSENQSMNVSVTSKQLQHLITLLWRSDINRIRPDQIVLNYQNSTTFDSRADQAPEKLFLKFDQAILRRPTVKSLIAIFNAFEIDDVQDMKIKIDKFYDEIFDTDIMKILQKYLKQYKYEPASSNENFRNTLFGLWFDNYSRSNISNMSSGFEHVFLGEINKGKIGGLHNWIRLYWLENKGEIDYTGYIMKMKHVVSVQFKWKESWKPVGSMFIGTSPEFDFAIYTLCFLVNRGKDACKFLLDRCTSLTISTFEKVDQEKEFINTAYPSTLRSLDYCISITTDQLQDIAISLWRSDFNRARPDQIVLNYQNQTSIHSRIDEAPEKFFFKVDKDILSLPTTQKLIDLFESYNTDSRKRDPVTIDRQNKINKFLDEILNTNVMKLLQANLKLYGYDTVSSDDNFRKIMINLWFDTYSRQKGVPDTSSGFEHVFLGEIKKGTVGGLHSWIRMYWLENRGEFDYTGYISKFQHVAAVQYKWGKAWKSIGGMFIGTSPEFDLAIYTLCFFAKRGTDACKFLLDDCTSMQVTTFDKIEKDKQFIGTAYAPTKGIVENCKFNVSKTSSQSSSNSETHYTPFSNKAGIAVYRIFLVSLLSIFLILFL